MDIFRRLTEPLAAKAAREGSRALTEAAMAAAALTASAGGAAGLAQRLVLDQILDGVASLRGRDPHVAVGVFDGLIAALRDDPEAGRARALAAISGFAGTPDTPRLLLRIARAMAAARGAIDGEARAEIAHIAAALGLPGEAPAPEPPPPSAPPAPDSIAGAMAAPVIVLGNEKGGTGKSTTALHLAVGLLARGHAVGTIDLDGHQGTLSRYLANRTAFAARGGRALASPRHRRIVPSELRDRTAAHAEERAGLQDALRALGAGSLAIVDTPGSHSHLSRLGLEFADILITPLNDSFLDIDVLARVDRGRRTVVEPSAYGRLVLEENARREAAGRPVLDWIVMRNRLAHIDARNTREMDTLLRQLGRRMGFRLQAGLSERVVFRELFYDGLTLLDPPAAAKGAGAKFGAARARVFASHRHARRELDELFAALRLPDAACHAS